MSLISWLNANSGAITAFATVIVAIATGVLAWITWRYAKTTDKILKASDKPEILIYLFPSEGNSRCINLCIQNIGTGFASDIIFDGDDLDFIPPMLFVNIPLKEMSIFKKGIDYLAPGKKIEIPLFITHGMGDASEKTLTIFVTYEDSMRKKYDDSFPLNLSKWVDFSQEDTPIAKTAKSVEKIASKIESVLLNLRRR